MDGRGILRAVVIVVSYAQARGKLFALARDGYVPTAIRRLLCAQTRVTLINMVSPRLMLRVQPREGAVCDVGVLLSAIVNVILHTKRVRRARLLAHSIPT